MAMPSTKVILFNAAASLVAIGAIVGVVRTWIAPTALRSCSERYTTSMVFPLERDGTLLTATDIQARAGGRDAGLLENLEVARLKRGPVPVAMSVELPKGSAAPSPAGRGHSQIPGADHALRLPNAGVSLLILPRHQCHGPSILRTRLRAFRAASIDQRRASDNPIDDCLAPRSIVDNYASRSTTQDVAVHRAV